MSSIFYQFLHPSFKKESKNCNQDWKTPKRFFCACFLNLHIQALPGQRPIFSVLTRGPTDKGLLKGPLVLRTG